MTEVTALLEIYEILTRHRYLSSINHKNPFIGARRVLSLIKVPSQKGNAWFCRAMVSPRVGNGGMVTSVFRLSPPTRLSSTAAVNTTRLSKPLFYSGSSFNPAGSFPD